MREPPPDSPLGPGSGELSPEPDQRAVEAAEAAEHAAEAGLAETVYGGPPPTPATAGPHSLEATFGRRDRAVSVEPVFRQDELIADRYRVLRFIARGGMSEVYAVDDTELGEQVALKTLSFGDALSQTRFRREITLARKIGHPNVCRIFDLGGHFSQRTGHVDFLTMELLQGQTLAAHLRAQGALAASAALPLVRQMAAGLQAAHDAGVIHRDLKTSNVFLVPAAAAAGPSQAPRVVITDFGVARALAADDVAEDPMTLAGQIIGTPAYMAPEQVQGVEVTKAVDIYALGMVIYEMVTGRLPFRGASPFTTAVKRLTDRPEAPRTLAPGLPPLWERVILRCLERAPEDRFASAADVAAALEGEIPTVWPRRTPARRRIWAAIALAAALAGAAALWRAQRAQTAAPAPSDEAVRPAAELRRAVAVLGFKNLSGDPDTAWLASALAEMIGAELAAGGQLRLIPGETVARLEEDLDLVAAETLSAETLARVRRHSGADAVVVGSSLALGERGARQVRLDLRVQDTETGESAEPVVLSGDEVALVALVARSGELLRGRLGVDAPSANETNAARAVLPAPAAARLYIEGLAKLRHHDPLGARADLERAIAAQPDYPLAYSALAEAWTTLGYDARAAEAARRGFERAGSLPLEERLWIEGEHYQASRDWNRAIETYRTLWSRFPDTLEYGLRLAETETAAARGEAALATLATLRELPAPASEDPRLDLAEYGAAEAISDFRRAREAAARAADKGARAGHRLLMAEARLKESWALRNLGQGEAATAAAAEARRLYGEAAVRGGEALAMSQQAVLKRDRGDLEGARKLDEESLVVFRQIGDQRRVTWALNNLAKGLEARGELAAARTRFDEALALSREIADRGGTARQLNNLAGVLYALGDLNGARQRYHEAYEICRAIADRRVCADILRGRGDNALAAGELAAALQDLEGSLGLAREIGQRRYQAFALSGLGEHAAAAGDLAAARARHREALAIREELDERVNAAASRLALADLARAEGSFEESAALARTAAEAFALEGLADREALARAVLAGALAASGQPANREAAVKEAARAAALAARSQNPRIAIHAALARAAVAPRDQALAAAADAERRATASGLVGLRLESALILARLRLGNDSIRARQDLAKLAAEAGDRGFAGLARSASELLAAEK